MKYDTYETVKHTMNPDNRAASLDREPDGPQSIPCLYEGLLFYYTIYG